MINGILKVNEAAMKVYVLSLEDIQINIDDQTRFWCFDMSLPAISHGINLQPVNTALPLPDLKLKSGEALSPLANSKQRYS